MRHIKFLWVITITGLSLVTAQTFADSTSTQESRTRPPMHGSGAIESGSGARAGFMESYLRTDLTETEKTAVQSLVEANRSSVKTILEANGTGAISDTSKTELQTLQSAFVVSILQYIATDKQSDFQTKFATFSVFRPMGEMKNGSGATDRKNRNSGSWSTNQLGRDSDSDESSRVEKNGNTSNSSEKNSIKKQSASEKKLGALVDTKLATFSTDAEKLAWMEDISSKIDTVLSKISSSSKKRTYTALKTVLQDKIDTMNGTTDSTDTSIESLLQ